MSAVFALSCVAILLANGVLAVGVTRRLTASTTVYGIALAASLALLAGALWRLVIFFRQCGSQRGA